jgi:glyoxylase-like metal-dependent hydrolase (beta-lactamase superfamily II)
VNYAWERLTETVRRCRLPFLDVTIGLVWGVDGVLLIDSGTTLAEAAAVDADVRLFTGRQVTRIVLTHKHFDHVLGSSAFSGAEVYSTPEVAEYMSSGVDDMRAHALRYGAARDDIDRAVAALRPPDHRVYHAVIELGGRRVSVSHPGRGHTTADLIVHVPGLEGAIEPSVVFCGDLVEESADPAIDADSDVAAWPGTLEDVLRVGGPDARYVPGHGAVVDARFIENQRLWLLRCPRGKGRV